MVDKQEIMTVIEKLRTYEYGGERPIAVVGPKLKDSKIPDKHLRAYAFGSFIGGIPSIGSKCGFQLADDNYVGYLDTSEGDELRSMLGNCTAETLCSDRYLELILKAAYEKFTKSIKDGGKDAVKNSERKIENNIVCRFMNTASHNWAAIDMEFTPDRQNGRHDIIFYDASDSPSYIITELKCDCCSTNNLGDHIAKMAKVYLLKGKIRDELNRRMKYLCEHGLESQAVSDSFLSSDKDKIDIWFGILYVDGGVENAEENVRKDGKAMFDKLDNDMKKLFYYQYRNTIDEIDIEKMKEKPLAEIMK